MITFQLCSPVSLPDPAFSLWFVTFCWLSWLSSLIVQNCLAAPHVYGTLSLGTESFLT